MYQNEKPLEGFYIKSGIVKSYNLTANGEEKPIAFNLATEMFPIGIIFSKITQSQYFYEAFTPCEVTLVPPADFQEFMKYNPKVEHEMFDQFVGSYIGYQMRIDALEQSKASDKVLRTLSFLANRFGNAIKKGIVNIQLPVTQQDMANFMGLTRETTGIELKKLERKGVVISQRQNYSVHLERLNNLLNGDYQEIQQDKPKISLRPLAKKIFPKSQSFHEISK